MTVRQVGVEEELLLVDADSGQLRPVAQEVIAACSVRPDNASGAEVKQEFFRCQVEVASRPYRHLGTVREELAGARARIADAARQWGAAPVALPGPVLAPAADGPRDLSPGDRYAEVDRHYGTVARESLMCALHVHVEVADDEEGVAVIDRVRPWIPVLVALGANSPYWHGMDSGYASWRSRIWNLWPTGGPAELFHDAATYHAVVEDMVRSGAALDVAMVNLDVRLSHRYPTVEFRVADVCTDLDDAIVVAALARALVTHAAERWRAGDPPSSWRVDALRSAAWRAARFGLSGTLVSPESRELADAGDVLKQLLALLAAPLAKSGDLELVAAGLAAIDARGNGAARQRAAVGASPDPDSLVGLVADLRHRTLLG